MATMSLLSALFLLITPWAGAESNDTSLEAKLASYEIMEARTGNTCITRLDLDCFTSCGAGATCSWGHCYCDDGTCAGLDDRCHVGQYQMLPDTYRISNSRWPEHFIKMGTGWVASTTVTQEDGPETEFRISVVHAPLGGGLAVLLISNKDPRYVLAMDEHEYESGGSLDGSRRRRKVEYKRLDQHYLDSSAEVEDSASLLFVPPESDPHPNATMVMIRGIQEDEFAYVRRGSWTIDGDEDDQGAGMYWYIFPPLPEALVNKMHAYTGERCHYDCGDPMLNSAMTYRGHVLVQGLIALAMLLCGTPSRSEA